MDFRRDRTDRWRRGGRGAQRADRIRNGMERTAKIVKAEPANACRRRPVYPVIEDIDQVPADRRGLLQMPPLSTDRQKVPLICGDALETRGLRRAFHPANTGQLAAGSDREGAHGAAGFGGEEDTSVA